jgi:hypothetical protein
MEEYVKFLDALEKSQNQHSVPTLNVESPINPIGDGSQLQRPYTRAFSVQPVDKLITIE